MKMTTSIASSAVLIEVNISMWTARKLDKKVSREIDQTKGATEKAGNYNKNLLAGTKQLDELSSLVGEIRNWNLKQTLPWSDTGTRLLPMSNFFKYKQQLTDYQDQFDRKVKQLIQDYPQLISLAAFKLGDLFKREDYPPAEEIERKFNLSYTIIPVPESGDFRLDMGNEALEELKTQYDEAYEQKVETAMSSAWSRVHTLLDNMVEKLGDPRWEEENVPNPQVYDSFVGNALDLTSLLSSLNVTNDPDLEMVRTKIEDAISGVTPNMIRKQNHVREQLKAKVEQLKSLV